jgi:hypothetical protein
MAWDFILKHPHWLEPDESPYLLGLPESFPTGPHTDIGSCGPSPSQCNTDADADYSLAHPLCKIATGPEPNCRGTWE